MNEKIGYPNFLLNTTALDEEYSLVSRHSTSSNDYLKRKLYYTIQDIQQAK
jgi:hypothetical protein